MYALAAAGLDGSKSSAPPVDGEPTDLYGATGLEPFLTSWAMVDQPCARVTASRGELVEADTATLARGGAGQRPTAAVQRAPGAATAEVWLHNRGPDDMGKVALRCSDLLTRRQPIAARLMRFEPDIVPMPARSSRGVTVEVDIDEHVAPSSYRGMLVTDGHPDVWLPIELVIKPVLP